MAETVNNVIKLLELKDDDVILLKRKNEKITAVVEHTAKQLKGDKRKVAYVRHHAGGQKYGYNAVLIVTEK